MRQRNEFVFVSVSQHIDRYECVENPARYLICQPKSLQQADQEYEPRVWF